MGVDYRDIGRQLRRTLKQMGSGSLTAGEDAGYLAAALWLANRQKSWLVPHRSSGAVLDVLAAHPLASSVPVEAA